MSASIIGAGLHPFGRTPGVSAIEQGAVALANALSESDMGWSDLQFVIGGTRDGERIDTLSKYFGLSGTPMINVFNGCATGGGGLAMAAGLIESGQYEVGAVVGYDRHKKGAFSFDPAQYGLPQWYGDLGFAVTAQFFGMRTQRYLSEFDIGESTLADVAVKARTYGSLNESAWRRDVLTREEVLGSPMICDPLRKYMFCSPSEGAAAVILCSSKYARKIRRKNIQLKSVALEGKAYGAFEIFQTSLPREQEEPVTSRASKRAFSMSGVGPEDIQVAQLQDTDCGAEIIHMAETGLCEHGEQKRWMSDGGGPHGDRRRISVNTDGGCLANGEPIGASGLRQICEVVTQLRGKAGSRQVEGKPKVGLTHVYGAPGISVVCILTR